MIRTGRVAIMLALAVAGCSSAKPAPSAVPSTPTASPTPSARATARATAVAAPAASRPYDDITVPGAACQLDHPIPLRHGRAVFLSHNGSPIDGNRDQRPYAELTINRDDEGPGFQELPGVRGAVPVSAISLSCDNRGGTADGVFYQSIVLYQGQASLGLITPQRQAKDEIATTPEITSWRANRIVVRETFYGPHDATCCPTGEATSTWSLFGGHVHLLSTHVVKQSTGSAKQ